MRKVASLAALVAILTCLGCGRPAWAQFSSNSNSGSMFGSGGGQSSFGFGSGSTSGSQFGSSSGMMGGGMGTMGGGSGMTGMGGMQMPMTAAQQLSQGTQAGGFVGATAQQMQRNFVGVSQALQAGGATGAFNPQGGMSSMGASGGGQAGMQQRPGGGAQAGRNQPAIRCSLAVGFDVPDSRPAAVNTDLAGLLSRAVAVRARTPIQVLLEGRTAVLRGEVATEHGRELAARLARLEGGIDRVQNEIVVAGSPATGSSAGGAHILPEGKPAAKPASSAPVAPSLQAPATPP
jgi:hypothetical protein